MTVHSAYAVTNKTKLNGWNRDGTHFVPGAEAPRVYLLVLELFGGR